MIQEEKNVDGSQFMRFYLAHEYKIRGYIRCMVKHWADVDDILQEATTVMWKKYQPFESQDGFLRWALSITRFEVLKYYENRHNRLRCFSPEVFDALEAKATQTVLQEDDTRREALQDCISRLRSRDRELLNLRYEMYSSTRRVAEIVGRSADAVYKALNRIHYRLLLCIRHKLAREDVI